MSEHGCITKAEQYGSIVQKMVEDQRRSDRERQIERAHGQDLPSLLTRLHRKHDGNASAVLRDVNGQLRGGSVSRGTLYKWLKKYEVRN